MTEIGNPNQKCENQQKKEKDCRKPDLYKDRTKHHLIYRDKQKERRGERDTIKMVNNLCIFCLYSLCICTWPTNYAQSPLSVSWGLSCNDISASLWEAAQLTVISRGERQLRRGAGTHSTEPSTHYIMFYGDDVTIKAKTNNNKPSLVCYCYCVSVSVSVSISGKCKMLAQLQIIVRYF